MAVGASGPDAVTTRRTAWLSGLVVGVAAGVVALELPTVGWLILIAFVVGTLVSPKRLAALGGLGVGCGAAWLATLGQSIVACRAFTGPGRECVEPDLTAWLAVAVAMVLGGALATIVAGRR